MKSILETKLNDFFDLPLPDLFEVKGEIESSLTQSRLDLAKSEFLLSILNARIEELKTNLP